MEAGRSDTDVSFFCTHNIDVIISMPDYIAPARVECR